MPAAVDFRLEWFLALFFVCGLFFWASLLFSKSAVYSFKVGWGWLDWRPFPHDLPRVMLTGFLVGFVLQQFFGVLVMRSSLLDTMPPGLLILFSILLFQGLLTWFFYQHLLRRGLDPLKVLGMENPFQLKDMIFGLVTYCMCLPWVLLSAFLTKVIFEYFQWNLVPQPMIQQLSRVEGWLNWLSIFLLVGFIGPLLEEVVFRGFLFTWLRQRMGMASGLLVQAFIFAVIHSHAASLFGLFCLALLLGLTYVYTRRMMACVWAHAFFNTMTLLYTVLSVGGTPRL